MQVPEEILDLGLSPREFYLLALLYRRVDRWGDINLTMDELGSLTGSSRTTLWRDMSALEEANLVETYRTRKGFNKFDKNRYRLVAPCFTAETKEVEITKKVVLPCFQPETSTAGQGSSNGSNDQDNILVSKTPSYLGADAPRKEFAVVNNWKNDDDDIGGFGLLDSDIERKAVARKPKSKRPINRLVRPEAEWTAQDVATEFAMMLYQHCKANSGPVDTNKLRVIIATYQKKYSLTSESALLVLRRMFDDENTLRSIKNKPENGYRVFLSWLMTFINESAQGFAKVDKVEEIYYIYSSDGTEFDNSMSGRIELEKYESSLVK